MKILLYREGEKEPFRLLTDPRRVEVNGKHKRVTVFGTKCEEIEKYVLIQHKCKPIMCENGIIEDVDHIIVKDLVDRLGIKEMFKN